eukprot:COSAG01_NODE_90_length_27307_cov_734.166458_35_plen_62_part_00
MATVDARHYSKQVPRLEFKSVGQDSSVSEDHVDLSAAPPSMYACHLAFWSSKSTMYLCISV